MTNTATKKTRKAPVMSDATKALVDMIQNAGLNLEQLRLLEREVTATKKAKQPKRQTSQDKLASQPEERLGRIRKAREALSQGKEAKAREYLGSFPKCVLAPLAGEYKVAGRSKIKAKADLVTAIVEAGLAEVRKAA